MTRLLCTLALGLAALAAPSLAQDCLPAPAGLLAWWPGDGTSLNALGFSPLVAHGAVSFSAGKSGQAFELDGNSGFLQWLAPTSLPLGNQPRTLALWFRTSQNFSVNTESALIQYGSEGYGQMFGLITSLNAAGRLYFFGYNLDLAGSTALLPNTWYFGAVTFDGTTLRLFVNGQQENSLNAPGLNTQLGANGLTVGYRPSGSHWKGQLDEVTIWNRALSAGELLSLYQAGASSMCKASGPFLPAVQGLKLWLAGDFVNNAAATPNGAAVTNWPDRSGLGNDATAPLGSAPLYRPAVLNGHGGLDFTNSTADFLATAFSSAFAFTNCTLLMVGNHAEQQVHVSVSAPIIAQEFALYDKSLLHESAAYHWALKSHQDSPSGFYLHAGLFGSSSNQMLNLINGVASTQGLHFSWESGQLFGVNDFVPVQRQVVLGWRNSNSEGGPAIANENFAGILCEVLVYDHQLSSAELNQVGHYLEGKYALPWWRPALQLQPQACGPGWLALGWPASPGLTYQLQTCPDLRFPAWQDVGDSLQATQAQLALTNFLGAEPQRFYRVRLLP